MMSKKELLEEVNRVGGWDGYACIIRSLVEHLPDDAAPAQPAAGIDVSELVNEWQRRLEIHQELRGEYNNGCATGLDRAMADLQEWVAKQQPDPAFNRQAVAEAMVADLRSWWVKNPAIVPQDAVTALAAIIRRHLLPADADHDDQRRERTKGGAA